MGVVRWSCSRSAEMDFSGLDFMGEIMGCVWLLLGHLAFSSLPYSLEYSSATSSGKMAVLFWRKKSA
jgi:hypothetical protein